MKRRVALIIGSLSAGGIATSVMRLAEVLRDGFEIHLVVLSGRVSEVHLPTGVFASITILDARGQFKATQLLRFLRTLRTYSDAARERRWDCAIAFGEVPGLYGAYGKTMGHHAFIASVRTDWINEVSYRSRGSQLRRIAYQSLSTFVFRSADQVVAVTEEAGRRVEDAFRLRPDQVRFIYNVFRPDVIANKDRGELSADEAAIMESGHVTFVAMGRLHWQKGFDLLVKAFARVAAVGHDAHLVILGKGEELSSLESLVRELGVRGRVHFLGHKSDPHRFVGRAGAFVLSSRWEGIANALVEAVICRVPIIAADCPAGPREILTTRSGRMLGVLVEANSVSALSDAMVSFIENGCGTRTDTEWDDLIADSRLREMAPEFVKGRWTELLNEMITTGRRGLESRDESQR
jgi:glycosyltransferase involved in cell wall biosynthesis